MGQQNALHPRAVRLHIRRLTFLLLLQCLNLMECFNLGERGLQAIAHLTWLVSLDLSSCTIDRYADSFFDPTARESFIHLIGSLSGEPQNPQL